MVSEARAGGPAAGEAPAGVEAAGAPAAGAPAAGDAPAGTTEAVPGYAMASGECAAGSESAGVPVARLPRALRNELVAWARAGYPNEACGMLSGTDAHERGGVPIAFHGMTNAAASPYRYLIDAGEQLRLMLALDDADRSVWGIFHSHVRSAAVPSPTDIGLAFYPDALYLLCSLADAEAPDVRAWRIRDGQLTEVPIEIEE